MVILQQFSRCYGAILEAMTQNQTLAILDAGLSVFLTGPAGSGKTYVLQRFIKEAKAEGKSVAVTASTGIAATHLGGITLHAWSGIGIADELRGHHVSDMSKSRREKIQNTDILIIDEVSMLHDFRLDMVNELCKKVREDERPFGGLQVVLSGDFFQLPPVNRDDSRQGGFVVNSDAWAELEPIVCYLEEQHRSDDDALNEILSALRNNDLRRRHAEQLLERKTVRTPFDDPITELHTTNANVDRVNDARLAEMDGEIHEYEMTHTGRSSAVESLQKSCLAPQLLQLKKGALVMFVKNAQDSSYANGTLGTVVGFDEETDKPIVQTHAGKQITVMPEAWEMRDGEKKIAGLVQLPLRLAWAITVHKSQGMTLDAAYVDLSRAFVPGMGYVALSRVRSLDTLTLGGLNRTALMMHEEAYELDDQLRSHSAKHKKQHAELEKTYEEKAKKSPKKKDGSWAEKLEKMRAKHPNAYRPWTEEQDTRLRKLFKKGESREEIAKNLGRHKGSITARLEKLELIESKEK